MYTRCLQDAITCHHYSPKKLSHQTYNINEVVSIKRTFDRLIHHLLATILQFQHHVSKSEAELYLWINLDLE